MKEEVKSSVNAFPLIAGLAILAIMLQAIHIYLATPIQVGVPLPPGTKRSKCGLIGHLPPQLSFSACTNSFLEVNADGSVSILNTYRELDMLLVGGVCTKENCIEGLVMHADRSVFVGGKRVKSLLVYGKDATVTPWPFEEAPRLKVKKFTLNK